jgi:hypothetical protein
LGPFSSTIAIDFPFRRVFFGRFSLFSVLGGLAAKKLNFVGFVGIDLIFDERKPTFAHLGRGQAHLSMAGVSSPQK